LKKEKKFKTYPDGKRGKINTFLASTPRKRTSLCQKKTKKVLAVQEAKFSD